MIFYKKASGVLSGGQLPPGNYFQCTGKASAGDQKARTDRIRPYMNTFVRQPQPAIFLSQSDPLKIDVPDQAPVQEIPRSSIMISIRGILG